MDRLITLSEQSASSNVEDFRIDENKLVDFMRECPIWTFFKIAQADYISKPHKKSTIDLRVLQSYVQR